jgi:glutathione-regulated potassium-efflux system ancillary protein KefG
MKNKILILFAHPAMHKSRINALLIKPLKNLEEVTFHDLYETYPDFYIDVKREQSLLVEHNIYVFMHPFYWYSTPAILKQWQDLVLEHGFAYGHAGTALHDKLLLSAITTSGRLDAYQPTGFHHYHIKQLLTPIEQTASLCGIKYLPPFVVHGALDLSEDEIRHHSEELQKALEALRDGTLNIAEAEKHPYLNSNLASIINAHIG